MVLGIEPTTFGTWVSCKTTRPGLQPNSRYYHFHQKSLIIVIGTWSEYLQTGLFTLPIEYAQV